MSIGSERHVEELVIEAGRTDAHYWRELWRYRDLFMFLAWRDLLVRFKQTVFGVLWAVLRPLITMTIFVVIFIALAIALLVGPEFGAHGRM